jgi:predicted DNA-binding transcriptional regulator YafY
VGTRETTYVKNLKATGEWGIMPEKYIGRTVEIIYEGKDGQITQRLIRVRRIQDDKVVAYDIQKRAPRLFEIARILATRLVTRNAS